MKKLLYGTLLLVTLNASFALQTAYAESTPRRVGADHRVKMVMFDPNNIVTLKARYGYQTQITFAEDERIQSVSLGDSLAWQAVPVNNHLFVKPMAASKTNMTVLTNKNSYNFQLDSNDVNVAPTYKLQFMYPEGGYEHDGTQNALGAFNPEQINWKYSFTGSRILSPIAAFDNGQFTYFKFRQDGLSHLPAIFIVDQERNESLVNFHMQGQYVVINSVARQFTLRDGKTVTSVYNDNAIRK